MTPEQAQKLIETLGRIADRMDDLYWFVRQQDRDDDDIPEADADRDFAGPC